MGEDDWRWHMYDTVKASTKNIFSQLKENFEIRGGGNNQISQSANISNISNDEIISFFHKQIVL